MIRQPTQTLADLYLADETAWLDAMAEMIRAERYDDLDHAHLAEFLADNARRDRWEVSCLLSGTLAGALMWRFHHDKLTPSRRGEILNTYFDLEIWTDTPTLREHAESILKEAYRKALERAAAEADVAPAAFPPECPWTITQLLADEVFDHR